MSNPDFLIAIPVHNESEIIEASLRRTLEVFRETDISFEVLVVDNASSDGTAAVVNVLAFPNVSAHSISRKGKGAAIWEGGRIAREKDVRVFAFIDADLSADPSVLPALFEYLVQGQADIVIGSRLLDKRRVRRSFLRTFSSELFNLVRRAVLGIRVRDTQCGMKLLNARGLDVLKRCTESTWFLDMELLARAQAEGLRVKEVAVDWDEFRFPGRKSKLKMFRDGVAAIVAMLRIRIGQLL